jgi:succinate-acetate transporter protein
LFLQNSICLNLPIISLILTLRNPILDFSKTAKIQPSQQQLAPYLFILIIFGFIMMFVPLILAQGQNLSLLSTATIEKHITINEPDYFFS